MFSSLTFDTFYAKINKLSHSGLIGDPSYEVRCIH